MYNEGKKVKELIQIDFFSFISLFGLIGYHRKKIKLVELNLVNFRF